jgi:hypothetical protein
VKDQRVDVEFPSSDTIFIPRPDSKAIWSLMGKNGFCGRAVVIPDI